MFMSEQTKKTIAIIQLDRSEQILGSLPAIHGIAQKYKDYEPTFFLSAEAAPLLPAIGLQNIVLIPRLSKEIEEVLNKYQKPYDLIINLSKSAEGLVLSSGLYARERKGLYLDGENAVVDGSDLWCTYLEGIAGKSNYNAFHNSDIYARVAGVSQENFEYRLLPIPLSSDSNPLVASYARSDTVKVALAVSSVGAEMGTILVRQLLQSFNNLQIILVGTLRSRSISKQIAEANRHSKNRITDLTGQTSIEDLAQISLASDLVVAKSGIFVQLCAGYGTLCLSIYPENSNLLETAPYGHGHLVFEFSKDCLPEVSANAVSETVSFILSSGRSDPPDEKMWQNFFDGLIETQLGFTRVFLTQRVSTPTKDDKDFIELRLFPLLFSGYTYDETLRSFYRLLWNLELDNRGDIVENLDILASETMPLLRKFLRPLEQMGELAAFGIRYSSLIAGAIAKKDIASAKASGMSLQEVDDTIATLANSCAELMPLRNFFLLQQQRVNDTAPVQAARSMELCYRELQGNVLVMLELINSLFLQESAQLQEYSNG
jgi:ADP-heptose:LPS heptosyltransferase